jgi:hypothetical protein
MAGKPEKKDKEKQQIERFKEAAKELGADESPEAFERAFRKVVKPPKPARKTAGQRFDAG